MYNQGFSVWDGSLSLLLRQFLIGAHLVILEFETKKFNRRSYPGFF